MNTFKSIKGFCDEQVQQLLRELTKVDSHLAPLSTAMVGSEEQVKSRIFANLSERAGGLLQKDIERLFDVSTEDIEIAKATIEETIQKFDIGADKE